MKERPAAAADEYNEDTDRANDSDEDQWNNKLVIDEQSNINTSENKMNSRLTPSKDDSAESKNNLSDINSTIKVKGKRGAQKKSDAKLEQTQQLNSNKQSETEKQAPNKPGRKKKEKQTANSKVTVGEVKNHLSEKDSNDPYRFDKNEGVSSSTTGKGSPKRKSEAKDSSTEYDWRSVGCITEPENLGPCESGTQVCLEGIVWQETNNGVLIVNVTWRGKSYMGTLLDATKYDWSPPSCESPVGELDGRTPKGRGKRSRVPLCDTFKDINERKLRKEMRRQTAVSNNQPPSPTKSENGKKRARNSESEATSSNAKRSCVTSQNGSRSDSPSAFLECPEPNCGKKYKHMNGLKYHQRNAHPECLTSYSDSDSGNEKLSSPEYVKNQKDKHKAELTTNKPAPPDVQVTVKPELPKEMSFAMDPAKSIVSSMVSTNSTSVITSTTFTNPVNSSSQSSAVPVAAITPQVIKPSSSSDERDQSKSNSSVINSVNRSLQMAHKLLPKTNMAAISTITTQGVYNPSLKPIQPKPTRIPDASPNPSLTDLRDHKKLKRKRSASKEDLSSSSNTASGDMKSIPQTNDQKPYETASDMAQKMPTSYSDIPDEGERKNLMKAGGVVNKSLSNIEPAVNPFLVAMVSPQNTYLKPELGADQRRQPENSRPQEDRKRESDGQNLELIHQYYPFPGWPMTPELVQMLMSKDKPQVAVSPQPNSAKALQSSHKTVDPKASSERLQLLMENMEMKLPSTHPSRGSNDSPKDYSKTSGLKHFGENSSKHQVHADQKSDQIKKDSLTSQSSAHKPPALSKAHDVRPDFSKASPVSFMPPPFNSTSFTYNMAGLANNLMMGGHVPFPLPGMTELKDSPLRPSVSPLYPNKLEHKIHELESAKSSQSPRPSHTPERQNVAKSSGSAQQLLQQALYPLGSAIPKL